MPPSMRSIIPWCGPTHTGANTACAKDGRSLPRLSILIRRPQSALSTNSEELRFVSQHGVGIGLLLRFDPDINVRFIVFRVGRNNCAVYRVSAVVFGPALSRV